MIFFFPPQPRVLAFVLSNVAALPLICRKKNVLGMIGSGKLKRKKNSFGAPAERTPIFSAFPPSRSGLLNSGPWGEMSW
jgi:hypothetical protein